MEYNNISKTIQVLIEKTDESSLSRNEKFALISLLEKLLIYYVNEAKYIEEHKDFLDYDIRKTRLITNMTDYIVGINDTLKGKNDVHCIVNTIYKEINFDEKKGVFKRKRLI